MRVLVHGIASTIPTCRSRVNWTVRIISPRTKWEVEFGIIDVAEHSDTCTAMPPQGIIWVHDAEYIQFLGGAGTQVIVSAMPHQDFCHGAKSLDDCIHDESDARGCACPESH